MKDQELTLQSALKTVYRRPCRFFFLNFFLMPGLGPVTH